MQLLLLEATRALSALGEEVEGREVTLTRLKKIIIIIIEGTRIGAVLGWSELRRCLRLLAKADLVRVHKIAPFLFRCLAFLLLELLLLKVAAEISAILVPAAMYSFLRFCSGFLRSTFTASSFSFVSLSTRRENAE